MLDSVVSISSRYHSATRSLEWIFTALFTIEYVARLTCVERPWRYARSFYGIVDLASVLPTYLAFFLPELHALIDVRVLRMLRVFRILKLTQYLAEFQLLAAALRNSRRKIAVFLSAVLMIVVTLGTVMYVVEGPENGFTSIPISVYWAITTMTTVGFGDITPQTELWPARRKRDDADGLGSARGADRHRYGRDDEPTITANRRPRLLEVWRARARYRRALLPGMRSGLGPSQRRPLKWSRACLNAAGPSFIPIRRPGISSAGGWTPPQMRDRLHWSA